MILKKIISAVCLLFLCGIVTAQKHASLIDTTISLKEFTVISEKRQQFAVGQKKEVFDSLQKMPLISSNLAELLEAQSRVFIKSYGSGSLATSSIRGGSANQTAVLWNGFNLQHPMHGVLDMSLIPGIIIDDISINPGSSSALWGSGAVGGNVSINNTPAFGNGFAFKNITTAGSFGDYRQQNKIHYSNQKFSNNTSLFYHQAKNDFVFINSSLAEQSEQRQTNSEFLQKGFLQENYFLINSSQLLSLRLWYQDADRQIPPTMLQNSSSANQKDQSLRAAASWEKKSEKTDLIIRSALFNEYLLYSDEIFGINSTSRAISSIFEAEFFHRYSNTQNFHFGINNIYNIARSEGYSFSPTQHRMAAFGSWRMSDKRNVFRMSWNLRQKIADGKAVPLTPSAGLELKLMKPLLLKINGGRSYRLPTFNDLNWSPGGNPNLLPESGWNQEVGMVLSGKNKFTYSIELTAFNRHIDNWIIWLPQDGFWTPQNLMKVWSRGTEGSFNLEYSSGKYLLRWNAITNYVISTNEKAKTENDVSIGKQLIYTPMYSGNSNFSLLIKNFHIQYNYMYTGYRYISSDNSEFLEPNHQHNIYAGQTFKLKESSGTLFFRVNNIFNTQYQAIAWRPMPGRNYQTGIIINIK
jgi:vitamin B12 transporter